jgi:hypothetical protein
MPRGGSELQSETASTLRDQARRARRLANGLVSQQDRKALLAFAEQLEARAAASAPTVQTFSRDAVAAVQRAEDDTSR